MNSTTCSSRPTITGIFSSITGAVFRWEVATSGEIFWQGLISSEGLEGEVVHALTFPLITTSSGIKMGKTHKGAIWLDEKLTPPYDYYQYWMNQSDQDIERFLALFTFLPMDEVRRLGTLKGSEIRQAKEVLAYEATALCHGKEEADKARQAAKQLFEVGGEEASAAEGQSGPEMSDSVPTYAVSPDELELGIPIYLLFERARLCKSRGEARRLVSQGGAYVNSRRIETFDEVVSARDMQKGFILLRAGKKRYLRIVDQEDEQEHPLIRQVRESSAGRCRYEKERKNEYRKQSL